MGRVAAKVQGDQHKFGPRRSISAGVRRRSCHRCVAAAVLAGESHAYTFKMRTYLLNKYYYGVNSLSKLGKKSPPPQPVL